MRSLLLLALLAAPPDPGPPAQVGIDPNAIQDPSRPMEITVRGIPQGESVRLQVLLDCDGDGRPDLQGGAGCRSPWWEWDSRRSESDGVVRDRLDFRAPPRGEPPLPERRALWLRASRHGSSQGRLVLFGLVGDDPCSLWRSLKDVFFRGECNPNLSQALRRHLGPSGLEDEVFEVRRLDPESGVETAVPGTRGATGVAWVDARTLLVTVTGEAGGRPGLLRIPLDGPAPEVLWSPEPGDERLPAAPLALPGGRVAFVRQGLAAEDGEAARLAVWEDGRVDPAREVALPARIHQLLASDAAGSAVLALTLGAGASHPAILRIDLASGDVENVGYHHALYHAALRSPRGAVSALAFEDNSGRTGWDLVLVDDRGQLKADLRTRPGDDLLPAWRPDGGELACLAEIEDEAERIAGQPSTPRPAAASAPPAGEEAGRTRGPANRLLDLLAAIPERWASLPAAAVPPSGRSPDAVLAAASPAERRQARRLIEGWALLPPEAREAGIRARLGTRRPTETEVWAPLLLVREKPDANLLGIWLQWAEALGRRDALVLAADTAIGSLGMLQPRVLLPIARAWAGLPAGDPRARARLAVTHGLLLSRLKADREALAVFETARAEAAGDLLAAANARRGEGDALLGLGREREALAAYRDARSWFATVGSQHGEALALKGEGDVLFRQGSHRRALAAYRRSRSLARTDPLARAAAWLGESDARLRLGENNAALAASRESREEYAAAGFRPGEGDALLREAGVLVRLGRNEEARRALLAARSLHASAGNQAGQANTFRAEAELLLRLGENALALAASESASALFTAAGDRLGQANAQRERAKALLLLGRRREALLAFRQAGALYGELGDRLGQANALRGEGDALYRLRENDEALAAYQRARPLFEEQRDRVGQGNALYGEARVLRRLGDWRGAVRAAGDAARHFRDLGIVPSLVAALLVKADAEERAGLPEAVHDAREALDLHARWRGTRITDPHRTAVDEPIGTAYEILVLASVREGRIAEALSLAEEARSRALLDLVAVEPSEEETAERSPRSVDTELARMDAELARTGDLSRRRQLQAERALLDHRRQWDEYQRVADAEGTLAVARPLDAEGIRRLARQAGPILLYYVAESESLGFLVLPSGEVVTRRLGMARERLALEARTFARHVANPLYEVGTGAGARRLWDLLVEPFADRLPASGRLVLVPHGPLHELPFEALAGPDGRPLFERWTVSVAPSASVLERVRRRHAEPAPDDTFLAFSYGPDLAVPEAGLMEIAGLFAGGAEAGRPVEAREEGWRSLAPGARHLLVASRGVHVQGSRAGTYLEVVPTPGSSDHRLSAAEIATIPLRAEMVALAACDTAHGEALLSDERLDLTRAFLIAGAASVLATRWKVPEDASTARFLEDVYRAWRQGRSKDEALALARRRSRERGDPAQLWAAWVLVGESR